MTGVQTCALPISEQTAASISGLAAGTYTITVTDNNGCIASEDIIITQPSAGISASAAVTDVSCYGLNSGAIDLTVNDGILPLVYSWNNGASTQDLENLTAGNYTVVVTDANNCQVTISATVNQPSALTADIDINNVACFGENSGSIDLSVTGGTMPYSFNWNNGSVTEDLVYLVPGT